MYALEDVQSRIVATAKSLNKDIKSLPTVSIELSPVVEKVERLEKLQ